MRGGRFSNKTRNYKNYPTAGIGLEREHHKRHDYAEMSHFIPGLTARMANIDCRQMQSDCPV